MCSIFSPLEIGILDIFGFENFPRNSFEQVSSICKMAEHEAMRHVLSTYIRIFLASDVQRNLLYT